jgi:ornithine cyclodeaminase
MKIHALPEIQSGLNLDDAFAAIREGFIGFSKGLVQLAAVGHLVFPQVAGDCHIKSAAMSGGDVFAIKIATGFPQNAAQGRRSSNGMMALFDAHNGEPCALLLDEGYLTDMRTAIAGAIAVDLIRPRRAKTIGIVGTGIQARLQAQMTARLTGLKRFSLWGRDAGKAQALAAELRSGGLDAVASATLEQLCRTAEVIITTTTATEPLLTSGMVAPNARIVAVGADAPGKQEIDTALVGQIDRVIADSIAQCLDHGELSWAYRAGLLKRDEVSELGTLLASPFNSDMEQSILVDLTGLGVQDLQIATSVWHRLRAATGIAH